MLLHINASFREFRDPGSRRPGELVAATHIEVIMLDSQVLWSGAGLNCCVDNHPYSLKCTIVDPQLSIKLPPQSLRPTFAVIIA